MKRIITLTLIMCSLLLTACDNASIGVIGGADGPTKIYVSENSSKVKGQFGEQLEKKPIRMFNVDGDLYYDSGLANDEVKKCGTMDGKLKKAGKENEIPLKSGEANFEIEGYQNATSITKEVNIDGKWVIFKKYDLYDNKLDGLKYCYYIKGHMNNAAVDSEFLVLTDNVNVTFNDVISPMLSSVKPNDTNGYLISHNIFATSDKWGITLYADNVTPKGLTLKIEQFGGNPTGELQTGTWYELETTVNDEWQPVKTKLDNYGWDALAYAIKRNDITEIGVNWEFIYGELSPGYYRLSKEVMDFREAGNHDEEIYQVHFTIE